MDSGNSETSNGSRNGEETDADTLPDDHIEGIVKRTEALMPVDRDSERYNMSHPERGKAVIFNHKNFTGGKSTRIGTEKDEEALKKCFEDLKFEVTVYSDLQRSKIHEILEELQKEDHSKRDCLVVIVLSHGAHDRIASSDYDYSPDDLWNPFTPDRCPTLAGKPKLFFIQACRCIRLDSGTKLTGTQTDSLCFIESDNSTYVIPNRADVLIVFSTTPGYYSFRDEEKGTWFIQTLTKVLPQHKKRKDFLSMMTIMTRKVAVEHETCDPTSPKYDEKKQVPMISSTLTREIWL